MYVNNSVYNYHPSHMLLNFIRWFSDKNYSADDY